MLVVANMIVYNAAMPAKPVRVSMDVSLLRRVDRDPETRRHGRSAFIRHAVELYLAAKQRGEVDQALRRAYAGASGDLLSEVESSLEAQAWCAVR